MKKTVRDLLSIILVICLLTSSVGAYASENTLQDGIYSPMWSNVDALGAGLTITSMGYATCTTSLEITNSGDTGTLYMYLQRYANGSWTDVTSWSTSGSFYVSQTGHYYVSSGYYYRVHAIAYIFSSSGTLKEIATQDSSTVYY